eukprot:TRINITY_DN6114_c0_g2_i1.p1 TRINITY_DN6114_c0_g2~~TRINITY_DN6114_c0_g2_i1.p1  ORF type:complete len:593 (+),score=140.14 TRINITY_DN6114_c0_g2_i1:160-1938(+)
MSNLTVSRRVNVVSKKGEENASRQSESSHHPHTDSEVSLKTNLWSLEDLNFIWKDLGRKNVETIIQLFSEDLDDCYRTLAEILNISDYRDNARSSILLDYHFWNLSFAIQECQFNKEKCSVFFSIMKHILEKSYMHENSDNPKDETNNTPKGSKKKPLEDKKRPTLEEVFSEFKSVLLSHTAIIQQTFIKSSTSPSTSFSNNIPNSKTSPSNSFTNLTTRNTTSPSNSFTTLVNTGGNTNTNYPNPIPSNSVPTSPSPPTPIHMTTKLPRKSIGLNSPASSADSAIPPAPPLPHWRGFTVDDAKVIADYATSTFFQHFNLYQEVFTRNQEVAQKTKLIHVDTAFIPQQLSLALSEEEWREQAEMMHVTEEIRNARELLEKEKLEKEKEENLEESRDGSLSALMSEMNGNDSESNLPSSQDKSNSPLVATLENLAAPGTVIGPEKILEIVNAITSNQVAVLSEALQKQYDEQERHLMNLITKVDNELERLSNPPNVSSNVNPNSLSVNTSPSNMNMGRTPSVNQGFNAPSDSDVESLSPKSKGYASGSISPLPLSSNEKFIALEKKSSLSKLNLPTRKKNGSISVPPNITQDL